MSIAIWITIAIVVVVVWGVIIYEIKTTSPYPSEYINNEEAELREVPQYEKSPPKSQTYSDPHNPQYKHWTYATTNCQCQMGKPVKQHTEDCTWIWENHGINYQISEIKKVHQRFKEYSDIAFDEAAQREYMRLEAEIDRLEKERSK